MREDRRLDNKDEEGFGHWITHVFDGAVSDKTTKGITTHTFHDGELTGKSFTYTKKTVDRQLDVEVTPKITSWELSNE